MKKTADNLKTESSKTEPYRNVMLLTMSTLPSEPRINTYQDEKQEFYFKGISQMEPHTKYIITMLGRQKQRLDGIVVLESEKAREQRGKEWGGESATSFYKKRIYNYLGSKEELKLPEKDPLEDLKETAPDLTLYSSQAEYPKIVPVKLEDPVFFWKAVQAIRDFAKGQKVHLYMDMQGGDRNTVSQMNAIVELLTRQKVEIRGRFANDYIPNRDEPLHTIREVSREYRTYDLISAMDIFARYGWGDKLEEYFSANDRKESKESRLVEAIKEASLSISRCNGDGFDRAVRKIESLQDEFKNSGEITEMDVVYQDIKENYEPLFNAKYRYVAQIRWCLDRSFLQQALTILEAKMPYEFVCSGLLYYKVKPGEERQFFEKCEEFYFLEVPDHSKKNEPSSQNNHSRKKKRYVWEHYKFKDINHFLIKDYYFYKPPFNYSLKGEKEILTFGADKKKVQLLLKKYKELCDMRNQLNHAAGEEHNPEGFFCYMKGRHGEEKNWKEQEAHDYKKEIEDFLDAWVELADKVPPEVRAAARDLS